MTQLDPLASRESRTPKERRPLFVRLVAGFCLFKTVLDQAYSSAMFTARSSYPIVNSVEFSIAASFAILITCAAVMTAGWLRPRLTLRPAAIACVALLLGVGLASSSGLLANLPSWVPAAVLPAVYGAAAVVPNAAWLLPIAHLPARWCLGALASSYLLAKISSETCSALPATWGPLVLLAMGAASVALLATAPRSDLPLPDPASSPARPARMARKVVAQLAGPLAVFVVLNTVLGLIMAFQVTGEQAVDGSSFLKAVASGAANLLLLGVALFAKGMPNIRRAFGLLFPVVALLLVALPFMDHVYGALFGVVLMFLQSIVSTMVLFMLLEVAKRRAIPVIAMVAAVSFVSRVFVLLGLLAGGLLGASGRLDGTVQTLIVVVVALYLLSLPLAWLLRGRAGTPVGTAEMPREFDTFDELDNPPKAAEAIEPHQKEKSRGALTTDDADPSIDALDRKARELAKNHRLTAREAEVGLLLARGRSATYIANTLGISLHTVRGYVKDVYTKLDVHSKQELIDLYTALEP